MSLLESICALHQSNKDSVERTSWNITKLVDLFNFIIALVAPSYEELLRIDIDEIETRYYQSFETHSSGGIYSVSSVYDLPLSLLKVFSKINAGATKSLTRSELEHILQWYLLWLPTLNDERVKKTLLEVMCVHEVTLRNDKRTRRVLREIAVELRNSINNTNLRENDNCELSQQLLMQVDKLFI